MNKQKELPNVNLQKTSVLFMQLGLILALVIVYFTLEYESTYKVNKFATTQAVEEDYVYIPTDIKYEPKKKQEKKEVIKEPKKVLIKKTTNFVIAKNEEETKDNEVVFKEMDDEKPVEKLTPDVIPEIEDSEPEIETIPFVLIEIAPTFPGCISKDEAKKKACFNKKMSKHITRKFNTELAQTLGLNPGKKKIRVQFVIDEKGNITNVKIAAPHKSLEKEAKRVIAQLPKMIPAKQRFKNVKVRYNLPIVFMVED